MLYKMAKIGKVGKRKDTLYRLRVGNVKCHECKGKNKGRNCRWKGTFCGDGIYHQIVIRCPTEGCDYWVALWSPRHPDTNDNYFAPGNPLNGKWEICGKDKDAPSSIHFAHKPCDLHWNINEEEGFPGKRAAEVPPTAATPCKPV